MKDELRDPDATHDLRYQSYQYLVNIEERRKIIEQLKELELKL